jgi:YVTN family beta-propeller protein
MKKFYLLILLLAFLVSCSEDPDVIIGYNPYDDGVFVLNEGNFGGGTGSLSFYSYDNDTLYNNLFESINERPLGDVAFSMNTLNDKAYIVVNNSGKIEVINKNSLKSISTISGLVSPRNISFTGENKAYVSSLYSDSLVILNLAGNSIQGYINIRRTSEGIITAGNYAYVANWLGDEIMVINTLTDQVIDSVKVGIEPESMVKDKNDMLWVLCNGGWARENFAELIKINTVINEVEERYTFPVITDSPLCLQIDGSGENLYFIEKGVRKMNISDGALPASTLIPESGHYFYKIGINPVNSDVFITDAFDYQHNGTVQRYDKDGQLISTHTADIIPAFLYFRLSSNFH